MAQQNQYNEIQKSVFHYVSQKINQSDKFELDISIWPMSEDHRDDLNELHDKGLIKWIPTLKMHLGTSPVSNPTHLVNSVIYYGNAEKGRCCVGYAIGCVNHAKKSIEIDFVEKRCGEFVEFSHKFLPIIVDAYSAYAVVLTKNELCAINQFAFLNPVDHLLDYYQEQGFEIIDGYRGSYEKAMVKFIAS